MWSGDFLENSYRGTRITTEIEEAAEKLACEVFRGRHAIVQPLSGHVAAMIVILSMSRKGDLICSVPVENGGYDGYEEGYIPDIFSLRSTGLPFDSRSHNLKYDEATKMIRKKKPSLVILGASFILFPYDIEAIRGACEDVGASLVYDGSHVLGLIAGGEFQKPLSEGAEVLYGSTHKSFFGPQGGLIVYDSDDLDSSLRKNLTWRIMDNAHWNRIAALGQTLMEMKRFGKDYARQVVKNARRFGKELVGRGFPIMYEDLGFTRSHQLLIDRKIVRKKYHLSVNDLSIKLEKSDLIIDSVGRIGLAEITRLGMKEKDLPELADLFIEACDGNNVLKKVKGLRNRFGIEYTF